MPVWLLQQIEISAIGLITHLLYKYNVLSVAHTTTRGIKCVCSLYVLVCSTKH